MKKSKYLSTFIVLLAGLSLLCRAEKVGMEQLKAEARTVKEIYRYNERIELVAGSRKVKTVRLGSVEPDRRYRIIFKAWTEGPDTMEQQVALTTVKPSFRKSKRFPDWNLNFFRGEPNATRIWRNPRFFTCILSEEKREYKEEFYTPAKASSISITFSNGDGSNTLFVESIRLEEVESNILNVNWDFNMGVNNYSGFSLLRAPGLIADSAGNGWLLDVSRRWSDPKPKWAFARTEAIPVDGNKRYRISFYGEGAKEKNAFARVDGAMLDGQLKNIARISTGKLRLRHGKKGFKTYVFRTGDDVRYIRLGILGGVFHWVRLEEEPAQN